MSRYVTLALMTGACVVIATPTSAQSVGEVAAYVALVETPVGGLPQVPLIGDAAQRKGSFDVLASQIDIGTPQYAFAVSGRLPAGRASFGFTAGTHTCDGCSGNYLLGVDWLIPLNTGEWRTGVRSAVGLAKATESSDGSLFATAVSLPISWVKRDSDGLRVVPFVEPGLGWGMAEFSGSSDSGTRPMASGGIALSSASSPLTLVLSARKVFIQGGETSFGLALSFTGR